MSFFNLISSQDDPEFFTLTLREKSSYLRDILRDSLPQIMTFLTPFLTIIIDINFISKYQDSPLISAFLLAATFCTALIYSWISSYNQAATLYISQASGAKDFDGCARYFRRNLIILGVTLIPLTVTLLLAGKLMAFFGVNEEITSIARRFTKLSIIPMIGFALFDSLKAFVIGQNIFKPVLYIQLSHLLFHFICSIILINTLKLGIIGAVLCRIFTEWTNLALLYVYIKKSGQFIQTWGVWSSDIFDISKLWKQFKWSYSVGIIRYGQLVFYQILNFLAYKFSPEQVLTHIAITQVASIHFALALGISVTMQIFMGNGLGERSINKAKNYIWAGFIALVIETIVYGALLWYAMGILTEFWNDKKGSRDYMRGTLVIYMSTCMLVDGINNGIIAVLKAVGKERITGLNVLGSTYVLGGFFVAIFAFYFDLKVKGIWIGFGTAFLIQFAMNLNNFRKIDWQEVSKNIMNKNRQIQGETELTDSL